jgi:8-oxo-dGTP diphosphatase
MVNTTLCYIGQADRYLMLHRTKKKNDVNEGKWIGVGGKFERDESPEECLLREVREETGLQLTSWQLRAVITFCSDGWETEYMYLFTADRFEGTLTTCQEGELAWIPKTELMDLNLWEGDRIFLRKMMEDDHFFTMKVVYEGDRLVESTIHDYSEPGVCI